MRKLFEKILNLQLTLPFNTNVKGDVSVVNKLFISFIKDKVEEKVSVVSQ
jgi:hypothetical protein